MIQVYGTGVRDLGWAGRQVSINDRQKAMGRCKMALVTVCACSNPGG